jgi:hypothetical protein
MVLDGKLHQLQANKPKQKEKVGNIKTCPACGAPAVSFTSKCNDCGHEFINTMAVGSIKKLNELLQDATNRINLVKQSAKPEEINWKNQHLYHPINIAKEINNTHAGIISSFPIPNTKEDLLEFLSISSAEAQKTPNGINLGMQMVVQDGSDVLINAWKAKFNQIINKSKIVFANDNEALMIIEIHERNFQNQLDKNEKKNKFKIPKLLLLSLVIFILIILFFIVGSFNNSNGREAEEERLQNIEYQISNYTASKQYDQALLLCNQLVWSHASDWDHNDQKYINTWDQRREEMRKTIERIKNEK